MLLDNSGDENLEAKSSFDLEKNDGHIKAKTSKQKEYEEEEERRKREAKIAVEKQSKKGSPDSQNEKHKLQRRELSKQEEAELELEFKAMMEPEIHLEEIDRNDYNQKKMSRPVEVQGIYFKQQNKTTNKVRRYFLQSKTNTYTNSPTDHCKGSQINAQNI